METKLPTLADSWKHFGSNNKSLYQHRYKFYSIQIFVLNNSFLRVWGKYYRPDSACQFVLVKHLAKIGDGLDESPTVMVGDNNNKNWEKIGAY